MLNALLHDPRTINLIYFCAGVFWLYFVTLLRPDYKFLATHWEKSAKLWKTNAEKEREITRALKARVTELEGKNADDKVQ